MGIKRIETFNNIITPNGAICQYQMVFFYIIVVHNLYGECTMFVYRRIRDLREDHDKTQSQIAKMLNMQLTVYQRYERGEREVPFWVAIKLADYYKVSLDYIAEREV